MFNGLLEFDPVELMVLHDCLIDSIEDLEKYVLNDESYSDKALKNCIAQRHRLREKIDAKICNANIRFNFNNEVKNEAP